MSGAGAGVAKSNLWLFAIVAAAVGGVCYLAINGSTGKPKSPVSAAASRAETLAGLQAAEDALNAGDLKNAYNQADAVLKQEPKNPRAREVMGDTLVESGAAPEGLKEYETALAIEPTGSRHYKAGKALISMGDPRAAAKHLRSAIKIEPGAAWAEEIRKLLEGFGEAAVEGVQAAATAAGTAEGGTGKGAGGGSPRGASSPP